MKKIVMTLPLLILAACGRPEPMCTFNTDGMVMQGFNSAACERMSVGYNLPG